jgi:hypothetical protein
MTCLPMAARASLTVSGYRRGTPCPVQAARSGSLRRQATMSACTASADWAPSTVNIHSRSA